MTPDALKLWYGYPQTHPYEVGRFDNANHRLWYLAVPSLDDQGRQIRTQEDAARVRRKPERPCPQ